MSQVLNQSLLIVVNAAVKLYQHSAWELEAIAVPAELLIIHHHLKAVGLSCDRDSELLPLLEDHTSMPLLGPPGPPQFAVSHHTVFIESWVEVEQ